MKNCLLLIAYCLLTACTATKPQVIIYLYCNDTKHLVTSDLKFTARNNCITFNEVVRGKTITTKICSDNYSIEIVKGKNQDMNL
jgi:hypothetical protein